MNRIDVITEAIIGDAISVHRQLGPGLLESTYEACVAALLSRRGMRVERQVAMPLVFEGETSIAPTGWTLSWNVGSWSN